MSEWDGYMLIIVIQQSITLLHWIEVMIFVIIFQPLPPLMIGIIISENDDKCKQPLMILSMIHLFYFYFRWLFEWVSANGYKTKIVPFKEWVQR